MTGKAFDLWLVANPIQQNHGSSASAILSVTTVQAAVSAKPSDLNGIIAYSH